MTKVVVPFDSIARLDHDLDSAMDLAGTLSAEIVLLRIHPLKERLSAGMSIDRLYTELKGLQARLADCQVPVTIETMPGPKSEAVASYADWSGEECISVGEKALAA